MFSLIPSMARLLRLPAKSLTRFQIVSKSRQANIRDPYFIKPHMDQFRKLHSDNRYVALSESGVCRSFEMGNGLRELLPHMDQFRKLQSDNRYVAFSKSRVCRFFEMENGLRELFVLDFPFTYPGKLPIRVISSCNGLLLFDIRNKDSNVIEVVIWNPYPFAQEWTRIKCPYPTHKYHLCYDELRDDLKIVGFTWPNECAVYSCKNNTWELKSFTKEVNCTVKQISFRGAVYCIESREKDKECHPLSTHIARYDVSSEELQSFPTPNVQNIPNPNADSYLTTSRESVYFYILPSRWLDWFVCLRIWVMNDDYSWEHLMTLDYEDVESIYWPVSVHFPNGRNDFVIQTRNRNLYSVDSNQVYKNIGEVPTYIEGYMNIGKVPRDIKGYMFNHMMDTLHVSSLLNSSNKK